MLTIQTSPAAQQRRSRPTLAGAIDLAVPGRPPHPGGQPCAALCVPACAAAAPGARSAGAPGGTQR
jgi:hypothetical protein